LPLYGLTNLFKCSQCDFEYLNENEITPLVLQCPKCKDVMLPEIYATSKVNSQINMEYYNQAIISLANSKVWLLIHPSLEEKVTLNVLRSALMVSNKVEEIFIIDKDINVRETYKNLFLDINENVKISAQISATEDFFNAIN
jgi:NAD-dependent SIR2 family protein deacetylase